MLSLQMSLRHKPLCSNRSVMNRAHHHSINSTRHLAKEPDHFGIRHPVRQPQTKETHKRQTAVDQIFRPLVREVIQRLDHQDFEHQNRIKGRTPTFASIRIDQSMVQIRAKDIETQRDIQNQRVFRTLQVVCWIYSPRFMQQSLLRTQFNRVIYLMPTN